MRLFMLLKDICLKLGLIADYVVELGQEDLNNEGKYIWKYRKWASGLAECWTASQFIRYGTSTQALLGGYYSHATLPLPKGLFNAPPSGVINAQLGTGVSGGSTSACSQSEITVYAVGNQNDRYIRFKAYVTGTWK